MTADNLIILHLHATTLNLGDEAIYESIFHLLKGFPICVIDMVNEQFMPNPLVVKFLNQGMGDFISFKKILDCLPQVDLVLVGGGDLILSSSAMYLLLKACRFYRIPVIFVGVGVNPRLSSRLVSKWQRSELPRCEKFWVRDADSIERLQNFGVPSEKIIYVPDIVYSLPLDQLTDERPPVNIPCPYIVVSVRSPEYNSLFWGDEFYGELAKSLDWVITRYRCKIVFLPFLSESRDSLRKFTQRTLNDEIVSRMIIDKMQYANEAFIYGEVKDFIDAFAVIKGAKALVGTRLHSLVFSSLAYTPFVALSYNLKTDSFVKELAIEDYIIKINRFTAWELNIKLASLFLNSDAISHHLKETARHFKIMAREYSNITSFLSKKKEEAHIFARVQVYCFWLYMRVYNFFLSHPKSLQKRLSAVYSLLHYCISCYLFSV